MMGAVFASSIFTFCFVLVLCNMLQRPGATPGVGAIPVKTEEFLRLLAKEEQGLVFCCATAYSHWYITCVKGNRICTKAKQKLNLPEHCELVKMKTD